MKRYRFSLDPVLRVRQIEQDAARAEFVTANHGLQTADARRLETVERYRALPVRPGAEPVSRWLAHRFVAECAAVSVRSAEGDVAVARTRMEEQRQALHEARMRTSAIERLDERRRAEHEIEARRAEDAEVDELVTARHGRFA